MIEIARGYRPALIGEIAAAHARWYAAHWGFGLAFEAKVAAGLAEYMSRAGDDDLTLSAWEGETFAGSLIVDAHDPACRAGEAHLRWFIAVKPGAGLGKRLMGEATAWLDARGLACFLDTFAGLDAARRLYEAHGFALAREASDRTWGVTVTEQRFERPSAAP
ncbi:MAG: GNAT family N-acetyltransferase [Pseudomonadota bacterium]